MLALSFRSAPDSGNCRRRGVYIKKLTRTIAVQPVRVFFIINVIVTGKMPILSLLIESKAYALVGAAHPPRQACWTGAYAASALNGCALTALACGVASLDFG